MAISDDHAGLKRAVAEVLPEACWQRCRFDRLKALSLSKGYVHFVSNALDHHPRKADDDCRSSDLRSGAPRKKGRALRDFLSSSSNLHPV